jgi:hypothetical protein
MWGFVTGGLVLSVTSGLGAISKLVQHFVGWSTAVYFGYIGIVLVVIMIALAGLRYYLLLLLSRLFGCPKKVAAYYRTMIAFSIYFRALSDIAEVTINEVTNAIATENGNDLA